ncbi:MAG: hypothetical protein NWF01_10485 [Candidatus Bathyarchaeota archaeon]|nr:hypothetical protein [Candidatus Bathyarchaeota archaeon]
MVSVKTLRFVNRNWDLNELSSKIEASLQRDDFQTQIASTSKGYVIQAKKEDLLRDILTATRAITILIEGEPNDFEVQVGIGKWIQNLAVTAVEAVMTGGLFLLINIPEMVWNFDVENQVVNKITRIVETKPAKETVIPA